jgi:hypothetical protein
MPHTNPIQPDNSQIDFDVEADLLHHKIDALVETRTLDENGATQQFADLLNSTIEKKRREVQLSKMPDSLRREEYETERGQSQQNSNELNEERASLIRRKAQHLSGADDRSLPWVYMIIYGLLLVAMFSAAALTAEMLFAEQGRILPYITSFIFIGGSCLLNNLHWSLPEEKQSRFFRALNWVGLAFFVGLSLSFALGRAAVLIDLQQSQVNSGSLFGSQSAAESRTELMQYATAIFAFVFTILLELCFGSTTLISIQKRRKPQIELNALETSLQELDSQIAAEANRLAELAGKLATIDLFDDYLTTWGEQLRIGFMTTFDTRLAAAKEAALRNLMTRDRKEIALATAMLSHSPQSQNGGTSDAYDQSTPNNGNPRHAVDPH